MADGKENFEVKLPVHDGDPANAKIIHGWKDFFETSSIPGLPKLGTTKYLIVKIIWLVIVAAGTAVFIWQANGLVGNYLDKPVDVKISVVTQRSIEFPSITICNMNPLRKSLIPAGNRFRVLADYDDHLDTKVVVRRSVDEKLETAPRKVAYRMKRQGPATPDPANPDPANPDPANPDPANPNSDNSDNSDYVEHTFAPVPDSVFDDLINDFQSDADPSNIDPGLDLQFSDDSQSDGNSEDPINSDSPAPVYLPEDTGSYLKVTSDYDYIGMIKYSRSPDFSDILKRIIPTRDEVLKYGHDMQDMLLQCTIDGVSCNHKDFYSFEDKKFGRCYTFNAGLNNKVLSTRQFGLQYGLKLTLDPQRDEYIGLLGQNHGFRVLIHHFNITPYPEDHGISVGPGFATQVAVRKNIIMRYAPFGGCQTSDDTPNAAGTANNSSNSTTKTYSYSVLNCIDECVQTAMQDQCKCSARLPEKPKDTCSFLNVKENNCSMNVIEQYKNGDLNCPCLQSCTDVFYTQTVSFSDWPSDPYSKILRTRVNVPLLDQSDLVNLHVFFEELNYQQVVESEGYPVEKLFADIGGILGLYVGMSIPAVFEVFELFYVIGRSIYYRTGRGRAGRGRVAPDSKTTPPAEFLH